MLVRLLISFMLTTLGARPARQAPTLGFEQPTPVTLKTMSAACGLKPQIYPTPKLSFPMLWVIRAPTFQLSAESGNCRLVLGITRQPAPLQPVGFRGLANKFPKAFRPASVSRVSGWGDQRPNLTLRSLVSLVPMNRSTLSSALSRAPGRVKNSRMVLLTGRIVYRALSPQAGIRVSSRLKRLGAAGGEYLRFCELITSSNLKPSVSPQEINCLPTLSFRSSVGETSQTASQGTGLYSL